MSVCVCVCVCVSMWCVRDRVRACLLKTKQPPPPPTTTATIDYRNQVTQLNKRVLLSFSFSLTQRSDFSCSENEATGTPKMKPQELQSRSFVSSRFQVRRSMLPSLAGSPSRGGDVTVYVLNINQLSLPTPFYSVLMSISPLWPFQLYFIPETLPNSSPLSLSVLPALFLP